ncbi:MAG: hypothetical protein ACLFWD_05805 [Anaerolineales bacterium]
MMAERVHIGECPLCGESHGYELAVDRKMIPGLATQPQASRRASFTCTFPCPEVGDSFQAEVTLMETPMRPIRSVKVAGVSGDDE